MFSRRGRTTVHFLYASRSRLSLTNRQLIRAETSLSKSKRDERWFAKFDALRSVVEKHGVTNGELPPIDDASLQSWLMRQRHLSKVSRLENERKELLESVITLKPREDKWENHFRRLLEFQKKYGHLHVTEKDDAQLWQWTLRQRKLYKRNSLAEERVRSLMELGLELNIREAQWMENYHALLQYKALTGHTIVPQADAAHESLAQWVDVQRTQYRKRLRGKASSMTEDRIKKLEAIDFVWNVHEAEWEAQYHDLVEHVRLSGLGNLPPPRSKLHKFITYQRRLHGKHMKGMTTSLTKERLEKLQKIGFCLD